MGTQNGKTGRNIKRDLKKSLAASALALRCAYSKVVVVSAEILRFVSVPKSMQFHLLATISFSFGTWKIIKTLFACAHVTPNKHTTWTYDNRNETRTHSVSATRQIDVAITNVPCSFFVHSLMKYNLSNYFSGEQSSTQTIPFHSSR